MDNLTDLPMKRVAPDKRHHAFLDDLVELIRKHGGTLTDDEILALTAHFIGQLVAMQDQRVMTPAMAMKIIAYNIEQGNQEAIDRLGNSAGTA